MELWIRSQDRLRLCKANNLFIKNLSICCSCNDENNDYDYLGVYSTKERVLEVLDEIQRILQPRFMTTIRANDEMQELMGARSFGKTITQKQDIDFKELSTYVYEMPKE